MLSQQEQHSTTNPIGFHRRQNSTPHLSGLNQPQFVTPSSPSNGAHRRGKSTSDASQHLPDVQPRPNLEILRRQSFQVQHSQATPRPLLQAGQHNNPLQRAYSIAAIPEPDSGRPFIRPDQQAHTNNNAGLQDDSLFEHSFRSPVFNEFVNNFKDPFQPKPRSADEAGFHRSATNLHQPFRSQPQDRSRTPPPYWDHWDPSNQSPTVYTDSAPFPETPSSRPSVSHEPLLRRTSVHVGEATEPWPPASRSCRANASEDWARASFQSSPDMANLSLLERYRGSMSAADGSNFAFAESHEPLQRYTGVRTPEVDIDDCVRETGITVEEIASFIQGPLPDDNKWKCLFEDALGRPCGKRFARKENAKSHVQTHLGDRQFVCKVCDTPFVRQHDLKRHFKIHTTEKPHKCPCGKDFHRHDALTRHRQRGMCVGAFEGSPKRQSKRGRPRKERPSTDERVEKAAKTRQAVLDRTLPGSTYASSISGSSECSHESPRAFDTFSAAGSSPSLSMRAYPHAASDSMARLQYTPPTSPSHSTAPSLSSPFAGFRPPISSSSSPKISSIAEEPMPFSVTMEEDNLCSSPPCLDAGPTAALTTTATMFDFMDANKFEDLTAPGLSADYTLFERVDKAGMANLDEIFNLGPPVEDTVDVAGPTTSMMSDPVLGYGDLDEHGYNGASIFDNV